MTVGIAVVVRIPRVLHKIILNRDILDILLSKRLEFIKPITRSKYFNNISKIEVEMQRNKATTDFNKGTTHNITHKTKPCCHTLDLLRTVLAANSLVRNFGDSVDRSEKFRLWLGVRVV